MDAVMGSRTGSCRHGRLVSRARVVVAADPVGRLSRGPGLRSRMRREGTAPGLCLLVVLVAASCTTPRHEKTSADLIVTNSVIYTGDPQHPWAAALAVRDGRLVQVGAAESVAGLAGPGTKSFDAGGRLILPAFHDEHVHPITSGVELGQCDLNGAETVEELLERIAVYAK